jgi:alpha-L-rhamnosidase
METHDHAMFAGLNASLYTELGGIKPTSPAYRTVTIEPRIPPQLGRVSTSIDTVRGTIASRWTQTAAEVRLAVTIPVGTTATVVLGGSTHTVGSGHWTFSVKK